MLSDFVLDVAQVLVPAGLFWLGGELRRVSRALDRLDYRVSLLEHRLFGEGIPAARRDVPHARTAEERRRDRHSSGEGAD